MKIFITGGTIDKKYNPLTGNLELAQSYITSALKQANCYAEFDITTLFLKDSLDVSQADRQVILQACKTETNSQIVITHGTDTMDKTAQLLVQHIKNKVIILTGAMIPYNIKNSDALFNLGAAITLVQCLTNGIYVTMGGKIFPALNVKKNTRLGKFEFIK